MVIKLIAVDLDGTLLNSEHKISDYNYKILKEAEKNGIKVIISTGRLYSSLYKYKKELELKTPVICYNGAKAVDGITDETLFEVNLDEKITRRIIEIARENNIHLNLFQDEKWYIEATREEVEIYGNASGLEYHLLNFDNINNIKATKVMFVGENVRLKEIEKIIKSEFENQVYSAFSKPYFLEILDKKVSKGAALEKISKMLNIDRAEIMAFGDGYNDIEMLEFAGVGVVMGNSPEELKLMFENIADSCNNDGVGKFIAEKLGYDIK